MDSYVCGILMSYDMDRFLLINKGGHKMNDAILKWQGPGGKINKSHPELNEDELPYEAMEREFEEETSHFVSKKRWHCFYVKHYMNNVKIYFFVCFCSPSELMEAMRKANKHGDKDGSSEDKWAGIFSLVDIFWDQKNFTFDIPYLIHIIMYEHKAGMLLRLDPEGINSAKNSN